MKPMFSGQKLSILIEMQNYKNSFERHMKKQSSKNIKVLIIVKKHSD